MAAKVQPYLVYALAGQPQQVVVLDVVEITVGREPSQDIRVPDEEVSRQHAVLRRRGERFSVEDRKTPLGTRVNGRAISGEQEIHPGDEIVVGPLTIRLGETDQAVPRAPNVRFGSQLKAAVAGKGDGSSTVLALGPDDMLEEASPSAAAAPAPVALSASGDIERSEVRDLDDLFDDEKADLPETDNAPIRLAATGPAGAAGALASAGSAAAPARDASAGHERARVRVAVEVEGPEARVRALLDALEDEEIRVPPLTIRVLAADES